MTRLGITLRLLTVAAAGAGGWFTAPFWQAQPSIRSAVRLLFRPAAEGDGAAQVRPLTLNGFTLSIADAGDPASLRALLERLTEAAADASPQEAEQFLSALIDQLSSLPPSDLRALALALARDRGLLDQLDKTTRALSLRLLSKDLELHLSTSLAAVIQRDPDRMLLLAEALPPSRTRDELRGRTLTILAMDRPEAVLALLTSPDAPLSGNELINAGCSAIESLAARSFADAAKAVDDMEDSSLKFAASHSLMRRINAEPEKVFAWLDALSGSQSRQMQSGALSFANPETARLWLTTHASASASTGNADALVQACGALASSDPAAAAEWFRKLPSWETGTTVDGRMLSYPMGRFSAADIQTMLPGLSPETQASLLKAAFLGKDRTALELAELAAIPKDAEVQKTLATQWARSCWGNPADGIKQAETLPEGPLRDAALTSLSDKWSYSDPAAWLSWMRTASPADQTAAMATVDPKIWSDPKNAAFLTSRPASEQLPWLASIYHENAQSAAAVIERASNQGASSASLDAAAKSLAESWQDRDPATARAFAQSLPDAAMADSVLSSMAASSSTTEARAAAVAAIQNPITRQLAERAAALQNASIIPPPGKR